jgi:hypothetical protein
MWALASVAAMNPGAGVHDDVVYETRGARQPGAPSHVSLGCAKLGGSDCTPASWGVWVHEQLRWRGQRRGSS